MDWMLLSYYLWERVVQDVIASAQNVCFRDDWAEETKADVAQVFHEYLAEGGATSLLPIKPRPVSPSDLTVHTRDIS